MNKQMEEKIDSQTVLKAEKFLMSKYFFLRSDNKTTQQYNKNVFRRMAGIINYVSSIGSYDEEVLRDAILETMHSKVTKCSNESLYRSIKYFYNEAIPVEYKNSIFSYKRNHEKTDRINIDIYNMIGQLSMEFKQVRLGIVNNNQK